MASDAPEIELVRVDGFKEMTELAVERLKRVAAGGPLALSRCLVVVPTSAARHLVRSQLEAELPRADDVVALPFIATPASMIDELLQRSADAHRLADPILRESILETAFESAAASAPPPFQPRGSLARRVLQFFDELRMHGGDIGAFSKRALEELEAPDDEGAEKMAAQTRFLRLSLEHYASRLEEAGYLDPVTARAAIRNDRFAFRQVLVLGADTLAALDVDWLARARGVERLCFVSVGADALPPWLHRFESSTAVASSSPASEQALPELITPEPLVARDREESLVDAVRLIRRSGVPLERTAIVVPQPLAYLYLAKKVLTDAALPFQLHDTFPLAAEPVLAAVDLALELSATNGHRSQALALLRSPFYRFAGVGPVEVAAFDTLTLRYHERGSAERWAALFKRKSRPELQPALPGMERADAAQRVLDPIAAIVDSLRMLEPLSGPASITAKTACLRAFLETYAAPLEDPRHVRARAAVDGILSRFEQSAELLGDPIIDEVSFRDKLKRAFETRTFDERSGESGVHVIDADSAGYGAFDFVVLMGLNEGEWPARSERNIFYPQWLLREFGWPSDRQTLAGERARFRELLRLPRRALAVVRHQLEDEVPTVPSPLIEDVDDRFFGRPSGAAVDAERFRDVVVTRSEALRRGLIEATETPPHPRARPGHIASPPPVPEPLSPTSLELYLRCPFKYFSRYLLKLEEEEDLSESLTPLERGRILHDVLEEGFREWDARGAGRPRPIELETYDEATEVFRTIARRLIPREHREIELARMFGGPGERGTVEWLLRAELGREPLGQRLLEHPFQTPLKLERGPSDEAPWFVRIKGRIDRADVDGRGRLHVLDYKSGRAPDPAVTLQVPLYAMCLSQELGVAIGDAAYISFAEKRSVSRTAFDDASARLIDTYRAIELGAFPPRPRPDHLCHSCGFIGVCRREIQDEP